MKALTFKQYRIIDLVLMSLLFIFGETIVTLAARSWFQSEAYSVSLTITFLCLVLMRWNAFAAVTALVGGLTSCLVSAASMASGGVTLEHFAIYCIGNLFALICIFLFNLIGKDKIRTNNLYTIIFVICVYLMTEFGRFCVSFVFERNISLLPTFVATDIMSGVFALVVILAVRKIDGMFEDQKTYLLRLEREKEKDQIKEDEFGNRV